MVIFLEAEDEEKLMHFYDKSGFKRFDTREVKAGMKEAHTLVQLLKIL